jgi:predicted lipid-binding transport protein (Tim44 family)
MRDELGHFFPEFDPVNITRWVQLAADHVFYAWREGDFESLESFSSPEFIETHRAQVAERQARKEKRSVYLDKVISVHTLGMEWHTRDEITHPPTGVSLTLRVETKAIDFYEDVQGHVIRGEKKPAEHQYIWQLIHNGNTWTLCEIYLADGDITHLNEHPPLPPISRWRHRTPPSGETPTHKSESTLSSEI